MDMRIHLRGPKYSACNLPAGRHSTNDDPYLDPVGADEGRFEDTLTLVSRPMWRHVAEALHGIASLIEEQLRDGS